MHFVDDEGGGAPAAAYARKWTAVEAAAAKRLFLSGEQRAEFESAEAEGDGALMAVVTRGQLDQRAAGLKMPRGHQAHVWCGASRALVNPNPNPCLTLVSV